MTKSELLAMAKLETQLIDEVYVASKWPDAPYPSSDYFRRGRSYENARLLPLITALIEDREALREALKFYTEHWQEMNARITRSGFIEKVWKNRAVQFDHGTTAVNTLTASDERLAGCLPKEASGVVPKAQGRLG